MKRAFLVFGAESSGTRFVAAMLMAAGCDGQSSHAQRFDRELKNAGDPIVWRRSFPHRHAWPRIDEMVKKLNANAYTQIHVIVTIRDQSAMIESQLRAPHIATREQGEKQIHEAYDRIFSETRRLALPIHLAVYESLVHYPKAVERLLTQCGLGLLRPLHIRDGNQKYFK